MHRDFFKQLCWGVIEINHNADIQWVNGFFEKMTGMSQNDVIGSHLFDFLLQSGIEKKQAKLHLDAIKQNQTIVHETKIKKNDGNIIDIILNGNPLFDEKGKMIAFIVIFFDITIIKNNQRESDLMYRQMHRDFIIENISAQEKKQEIFSRQLNKRIEEAIVYSSLYLQRISTKDKENKFIYFNVHEKISQALNEVRKISRELMPYDSSQIGLKDAIIELLNRHSDIKETLFVFSCRTVDFSMLEMTAQQKIYRIIEELTHNAVRHSKSSIVQVKLKNEHQNLVLIYKDNGVGFDIERVKKGFGIRKICKMVELYHGDCKIKSVEDRGTTFNIQLPLDKISTQKYSM